MTMQTMGLINETEAQIILALADNGLVISRTARAMCYHRNTIDYHVRQIRIKTGKNAVDFYDMCKLLPVAREIIQRSRNSDVN